MTDMTDRLCVRRRRESVLLFCGIAAALRYLAAIGRSWTERTVPARYSGWGWSDFTERALNDDLTGQGRRSFRL
jgi:hypothetical protein